MKKRNESGLVIVEASIVFPVMFLVIFLMFFVGNAYYQKCRVEAVVNQMTINGAAYCADPLLENVEENKIPDENSVNIAPYRFIFGGVEQTESDVADLVSKKFKSIDTGLFSNMRPSSEKIDVKYNNHFIYSTFSVDIQYKIVMPIRLLGMKENMALYFSSHADMPVSDSPEFIRNVDMVEDYIQRYGVDKKIEELTSKVKEWLS